MLHLSPFGHRLLPATLRLLIVYALMRVNLLTVLLPPDVNFQLRMMPDMMTLALGTWSCLILNLHSRSTTPQRPPEFLLKFPTQGFKIDEVSLIGDKQHWKIKKSPYLITWRVSNRLLMSGSKFNLEHVTTVFSSSPALFSRAEVVLTNLWLVSNIPISQVFIQLDFGLHNWQYNCFVPCVQSEEVACATTDKAYAVPRLQYLDVVPISDEV